MNIGLWVLQILLGLVFVFHAYVLLRPSPERLQSGMSYVLEMPARLRMFAGVAEGLAGIGLILPALLRILPWLTPVAAAGLVVLMLGAIVFHVRRREYPNIGLNAVLGVLAAIVAWGRFGPLSLLTSATPQFAKEVLDMGTWNFDPYHTQVEFSAKHLGMMTVRGHFAEVTATGDIHPEQPERSTVEATINTASIRSNNEQRDKDLRASNFLEVDKYPTITFKSTKIAPAGPDRYTLTGDLTIKGNTRPVTLNVVKYGEFNDPNMGHRIGYAAEGEINRKDFGMKFEMMLDGKFIVSNEIQINIEGELLEAKESEAAGSASR